MHSATLTNKFQGWMELYQKHVFFWGGGFFLSWRPDFWKKQHCYFLIGAIDSHKRVMYFFYTWKNPSRPSCDDLMEILKPRFGKFFFWILAARISNSGRSCASGRRFQVGAKNCCERGEGASCFWIRKPWRMRG